MAKNKRFIIHHPDDICEIRKAAQAAATVKNKVANCIQSGMTTKMIDEMALAFIASEGGTSAFRGYKGFPGVICISVNDEVVHGIGNSDYIIYDGDIVSIDVGVNLNGFIGDNALTVAVGDISDEAKRLMKITKLALFEGIKAAKYGNFVRDISIAVEKVAKRAKLGIVQDYVGHGCGRKLHEPPEIPNFRTKDRGPKLIPGMVLAIEPMFNLGGHKVFTDTDKWTVKTKDRSLSAHFEHMILITKNEPEILTWQKT